MFPRCSSCCARFPSQKLKKIHNLDEKVRFLVVLLGCIKSEKYLQRIMRFFLVGFFKGPGNPLVDIISSAPSWWRIDSKMFLLTSGNISSVKANSLQTSIYKNWFANNIHLAAFISVAFCGPIWTNLVRSILMLSRTFRSTLESKMLKRQAEKGCSSKLRMLWKSYIVPYRSTAIPWKCIIK